MSTRLDPLAGPISDPRYAGIVRSYLSQLAGPERAGPAAQRVLDEFAPLAGGSGAPDLAKVRKVAQRAGLDALDAGIHRFGGWFFGAVPGHARCAGVVHRLRERADGRISAGDLDTFYRHVERCHACSTVVGRFEGAEWYLQAELCTLQRRGEPAPADLWTSPLQAPPGDDGIVSAARIPPVGHVPAAPQALPLPAAAAEPLPVAAAEPLPLPAQSAPAAAARVGWQPRRRVQALDLAVVAIAVGGVILLPGVLAPKRAQPAGGARPVAPATPNHAIPPAAQSPAVAARGDGTPFVAAGVRFAVFVNAPQRWTAFAKRVPAGPGGRWLLVTVRTRNLTRPNFDPRLLAYRLIGPGGVSYTPNPAHGTGADTPPSAKPTGRGTLAQAELAFAVPRLAAGLQLAFDPAGPTGAPVVVTFGV